MDLSGGSLAEDTRVEWGGTAGFHSGPNVISPEKAISPTYKYWYTFGALRKMKLACAEHTSTLAGCPAACVYLFSCILGEFTDINSSSRALYPHTCTCSLQKAIPFYIHQLSHFSKVWNMVQEPYIHILCCWYLTPLFGIDVRLRTAGDSAQMGEGNRAGYCMNKHDGREAKNTRRNGS